MKKLAMILLALAATLMLPACGSSSSKESAKKEEKEPEYASVGTESEDAVQVLLTNKTGTDITSFVINSSEDKGENLLDEGDAFANDETRRLYFIPVQPSAVKPVEYTVIIKLADDTTLRLHQFPLEDMEKASIGRENSIGYIVYESLTTKESVNTLEAEKAIRMAAIERRKAQKEAEERAKREAEEAAEAQKAAQAEAEAAAAMEQAAQQAEAAAAQKQQQ